MSKWYYSLEVTEPTNVIVGIHQEDERIAGVASRRPYLDIGIVILQRHSDGNITLLEQKDLVFDRQCEMELDLDPGSYIILPRTTGCTLRRPPDAVPEKVNLLNRRGQLSELAESTISDIFRKFDMLLNRELTFNEFKSFYECIFKNITENEFRQNILKMYTSSERGLSLRGI